MKKTHAARVINPILFTKEGFEVIKKEHEELLTSRPHAVSELKRAREMGDLSENGFYKSARAKLSQIDSRLRHLKHLLRYGTVKENGTADVIDIGSKVTLSNENGEHIFTIVGGYESDPKIGKISLHSPIGKALMGRRIGETVTVFIPSGSITYKVIKVY